MTSGTNATVTGLERVAVERRRGPWRSTEMSGIQLESEVEHEMVSTVLTHLSNGRVKDAVACFAENFQFNDRGIGLEFSDKERLGEFFQKRRELCPDSSLQTNRILASSAYVATEWTLRTSVTEPFWGGRSRTVQISVHGASIVRLENGKIVEWSDYYDGLASRRTALASYFIEWVEA